MRIGFDVAMRDANTPEQFIAAQMALCLEQTGCLPDIEEITEYVNTDDEFGLKFQRSVRVSEATVYAWVMNILKEAMI